MILKNVDRVVFFRNVFRAFIFICKEINRKRRAILYYLDIIHVKKIVAMLVNMMLLGWLILQLRAEKIIEDNALFLIWD
ncbi:MAG: hypothetical protein ACTSVI_13395 [Promethearchaeota archaeon]